MSGSGRETLDVYGQRRWPKVRTALLFGSVALSLLAVGLPAYAGDDDDDSSSSWTDRIGDSIKNSMSGITKSVGLNKPAPPPVPESPSGCPSISVLDGTEAQRVMVSTGAGNEGLRYQYSIQHVGRECSLAGGRVAIKVGASGRVLLGPAGSPGNFDVPLRVVVFSILDQKPVQSKLYRVGAAIPAGQSAAPFQFVSDNIVIPVGAGRTAGDYAIKVGIDGAGKASAPSAKSRKHGRKGTQSASQ